MTLKNKLIKYFLQAVKAMRKTPNEQESKRFLIVSTTGLGDTLWGTPAIKALRQSYPDSYIAALTSPIGEEVLRNNPHLSEVYTLKTPLFFSFIRLYFRLRKRKITTALILHTSQRAALPFCHLIGATTLIGTEGINKGLDFLLTHPLEKKREHEIERRFGIVVKAGAVPSDPYLELFPTQKDEQKANEFLLENEILPFMPIVGIHPGAKDKFKQWHPDCFIELAKRLQDHLGCQILITGNASEKELMQKISHSIPNSIALTDPLSLTTFAALLKRMSLFIVNDTGPMHVAFSVNAPTIALFGPTDPKLCGPHFAKATVIRKEPTCTPCLRKACQDPFCLLQISVDEVYNSALSLFYNNQEVGSSKF